MERKLATIQRIVSIDPIEGADRIVKATVLGWECVVKKDEFKPGDLCVYIEIDSIVPAVPYFFFMEERKYRVKTIKLRKQVSQGLIIPFADIFRLTSKKINPESLKEGDDVTELLGVVKWESPSDREANHEETPKKKHNFFVRFMTRFSWYRKLTKTKSKSFPNWIAKTDEERIQNIPSVLTKFKDADVYITEKVDGQSATYWYIHKKFFPEFGICSRSVRKFELDNSNWSRTAKLYNIKEILKNEKRDIAIQGEIIAPSVQGNKYSVGDFKFYVYNVFDIKDKRYYTLEEMIAFCDRVGLTTVPIVNYKTKLLATVPEMIELSKGTSVLHNTPREGIVVRTLDKSLSFKAINPDFLLKYGL